MTEVVVDQEFPETWGGRRIRALNWDDRTVEMLFAIEMTKEVAPPPHNCPHGTLLCNHPRRVEAIVIHLNDDCGWTREEIADWLDAL